MKKRPNIRRKYSDVEYEDAGSEAAIHAMHDIFEDNETEALTQKHEDGGRFSNG